MSFIEHLHPANYSICFWLYLTPGLICAALVNLRNFSHLLKSSNYATTFVLAGLLTIPLSYIWPLWFILYLIK